MADYALVRPKGQHYRLIHSKYPPIDLFDSQDSYDLGVLESATSDRLHNWDRFVDPKDLRTGPGWSTVMASFCYPGEGGRFNAADQGAYYAGLALETAVREWAWHTARVWRGFNMTEDASAMARCYTGKVARELVDVRGDARYCSEHYSDCRLLGRTLLNEGFYGLVYDSVRHAGGANVAFLRPPGTTAVKQKGHCVLKWDGERFTDYLEAGDFVSLGDGISSG
ncbi:RES family NAD+ phosphorylase [Saccharospirillum sp.]|uniref:RES family NAD+ phosphorylase n=1 Tax=Saccharospirillum sp. TaxID=2033801 RepID=UPI0034A03753